ncbi:1-acyl-sn-glycerol-3-phosphate acyltransferase [Chitinibacter sp. SCUT-21]|uniref:lysophospholipid acyltransferase family protein n=1 Tax=Chitinibacter sp. SCUT-21 TaxID=2970891 RepID=UPI0035A64771
MRKLLRTSKLISHLGVGLFIITFVINKHGTEKKAELIRNWSKKLTKILGVKVIVKGKVPPTIPSNYMFLSNHISWFDIFALNTIYASRFIAKADIQSWPLINRLCVGAGTFFIQREKIKDTKRVNDAITECLQNGECVTFFPEGTTTDGTYLKPLKTSLLQSIVTSQGHVQAIYLNYLDDEGKHSEVPAYVDDMTFLQSLNKLLGNQNTEVHIRFMPAIKVHEHDRASISAAVKAQLHEAHLSFHQQLIDKHVEQKY